MNKDKIIKINNECKNGFEVDLQALVYRKEKELVKRIYNTEDKDTFLEFKIYVSTTYKNYNKINVLKLHISKCYKENGCYISYGLGKFINLYEVNQNSWKNLIKATKDLDDEYLLNLNKENKVGNTNGIIESEEF